MAGRVSNGIITSMITNRKLWRQAEIRFWAKERLSYKKARQIYNALYREARALGFFKGSDPLEGFEIDLRLARILNHASLR